MKVGDMQGSDLAAYLSLAAALMGRQFVQDYPQSGAYKAADESVRSAMATVAEADARRARRKLEEKRKRSKMLSGIGSGLGTIGSAMMVIPVPPVQIAGGALGALGSGVNTINALTSDYGGNNLNSSLHDMTLGFSGIASGVKDLKAKKAPVNPQASAGTSSKPVEPSSNQPTLEEYIKRAMATHSGGYI